MLAEETPAEAGLSALGRVLSNAVYARLYGTATLVMAAQWMQRIGLGWLIWDLTGSGAWLGLLAIAELAPGLVLGPAGGVLSDRIDNRKIVFWSQLGVIATALVTGVLVLAADPGPAMLVVLAGCGGSAGAIQESSRSLLLRDATPASCLPTGMSLMAISVNVTRFLGPAIAGPLIQVFGVSSVFWVYAAVSVALCIVVTTLPTPAAKRAGQGSFLADLRGGVVAAATHPSVTPVLLVFALTALGIRPLYELMPAFAAKLFSGEVAEYSSLIMAVGIGAVVGAVYVTLKAPTRPGRMFMWSSVGACLALAGFALAQNLIVGLIACGWLGLFMCTSAATSQLAVILHAEPDTTGRVLSLWGTLMRGGPALGALVLGGVVDAAGYRTPLIVSAALGLVCILIVSRSMSQSRRAAAGLPTENTASAESKP